MRNGQHNYRYLENEILQIQEHETGLSGTVESTRNGVITDYCYDDVIRRCLLSV